MMLIDVDKNQTMRIFVDKSLFFLISFNKNPRC